MVENNHELESSQLTQREKEVLGLVKSGLANKQIATTLSICEKTVEYHLANIYAKLGVASRIEAVVIYMSKEIQTDTRDIPS